jgi:hypothetical protein
VDSIPVRASETPRAGTLTPLADSIARRLVFVPTTQDVFLAAARGKRMLVDIGRVDFGVARPPSRLAAYKEVVGRRSPLAAGTRLRLRGEWGADDVEVSGFDVWNGRIVATLKGTPRVDSLARVRDTLIAVAQRSDSAREPVTTTCARDSVDTLFHRRIEAVRDSLLQLMRESEQPAVPRLRASIKEYVTTRHGCFPAARAILAAARVAGDYEWVRERVLFVAADGKATAFPVRDFRFRAHELQHALDADEDGADEVAARAYTPGGGGTVVLRVVDGKRLERMISGFAWER